MAIAGTAGGRDYEQEWWWPGSPWWTYLASFGVVPLAPDIPFEWSTDLNFGGVNTSDWRAGGAALFYYLVPPANPGACVPPKDVHLVSHSHGRQLVLFALSFGLKVDTWIDVCGPVRDDMLAVQQTGRANVRRHVHVHGNITDWWQILGQLGDRQLLEREDPLADLNVAIAGGHTCLLDDLGYFSKWPELGLIGELRGER